MPRSVTHIETEFDIAPLRQVIVRMKGASYFSSEETAGLSYQIPVPDGDMGLHSSEDALRIKFAWALRDRGANRETPGSSRV